MCGKDRWGVGVRKGGIHPPPPPNCKFHVHCVRRCPGLCTLVALQHTPQAAARRSSVTIGAERNPQCPGPLKVALEVALEVAGGWCFVEEGLSLDMRMGSARPRLAETSP